MSAFEVPLKKQFLDFVLASTGATAFLECEKVQSLWSGYGQILRVTLAGGSLRSVVLKHVNFRSAARHPRRWDSETSHQRKVNSYEIELAWYREWGRRCNDSCRVPALLGSLEGDGELLMILEDLDAAGFPERKTSVTETEMNACLEWLGNFHARFLGVTPTGLWDTGTYWHLETRPDEWDALDEGILKEAAPQLDRYLKQMRFQTLVHGDAKIANFCFSETGEKVAAVDFQYVGGGCGMKDLSYFLGSCLNELDCEEREQELLDRYFDYFREGLRKYQPEVDPGLVEQEWRESYPITWADFHRFLTGWSPGHWKINRYSEAMLKKALNQLAL